MTINLTKIEPDQRLTPKFDWYSCSVPWEGDPREVASRIASWLDCDVGLAERKRIAQYTGAYDLFDVQGWFEGRIDAPNGLIGFVAFGGSTRAMRYPHVRGTGKEAHDLALAVKQVYPRHKVSRVDSCIDMTGQGLFDQLHAMMDDLREAKGLYRRSFGFAAPENGRSFYLGSPQAPVQVRCYEKGLKSIGDGYTDADPFHVRLEVQVRPRSAEKHAYAAMSASDVWGGAAWSSVLLQQVTAINPPRLQREPTMIRTPRQKLEYFMDQYRRLVLEGSADMTDAEWLALAGRGPLADQYGPLAKQTA